MKASDRNILRGIENIMMDMLDNPEWLHRKRFWNIRHRQTGHRALEHAHDRNAGIGKRPYHPDPRRKKLTLKVNCSTPFVLKTWSTEPTTDYDAPNPGAVLVGFELQLAPHQKQAVDIALIPGSAGDCQIDFSALAKVMAGIPLNDSIDIIMK
jgi:hypothetical protein